MTQIFVNLKRFDVPRELGGVCGMENASEWIKWVIGECVESNLGKMDNANLAIMLPESLIIPAKEKLESFSKEETKSIQIGCQGVFREDIAKGVNFGAFTTNRPAAAAKNIGCEWSIIAHSEERKDKLGIIAKYDQDVLTDMEKGKKARLAVDNMVNEEVKCAISRGIKALFCIGETAEEKGEGTFEEQKPRIEEVLKNQLVNGLAGIDAEVLAKNLVVAYEPIWAIGPGKTPPGGEYIAFVSELIKKIVKENFGFEPLVVYGGGLKEENAGMISSIPTIDGGLVALTRFVGEIGFYPDELKKIIEKYMEKA